MTPVCLSPLALHQQSVSPQVFLTPAVQSIDGWRLVSRAAVP